MGTEHPPMRQRSPCTVWGCRCRGHHLVVGDEDDGGEGTASGGGLDVDGDDDVDGTGRGDDGPGTVGHDSALAMVAVDVLEVLVPADTHIHIRTAAWGLVVGEDDEVDNTLALSGGNQDHCMDL